MPTDRKDYMKNAQKASRIKKKIAAKTATNVEKAFYDDWQSKLKLKKRAKPASPRTSTPDVAPAAPDAKAASWRDGQAPTEVMNTLPGSGGKGAELPPLDVGSGDGASSLPSNGPTASDASDSSSSSGESTSSSARSAQPTSPAMTAEEAEASGKMIADLATQILGEFNAHNAKHGAPALGEEILKLFHFSVKRMSIKYGGQIDEDTYDSMIIFGSAGFVGFHSVKISRQKKKEETPQNVAGHAPAEPVKPTATPKSEPTPGERRGLPDVRAQPRFEGSQGVY